MSLRTSSLLLIAANLVPAVGVIFAGWSGPMILAVYWAESAVVGFLNVQKLILCSMWSKEGRFEPAGGFGGLFMACFFSLHFGGFMLGHGVFLLVISTLAADIELGAPGLETFCRGFPQLCDESGVDVTTLALLVAPFVLSHGASFFLHYVRGKQYIPEDTGMTMIRPYRRIIVMHITIIVGFVLTLLFGGHSAPIVAWTVLKTISDLRAHMQEHAA